MAFITFCLKVLPCKYIFRVPVVIKFFNILPSDEVMTTVTVLIQFTFMLVFMARLTVS